MPAEDRSLVAVFAQGYAGVLQALFDVVGIGGPWRVTDGTGQFLDPFEVFSFFGREFVIHGYVLPNLEPLAKHQSCF